MRIPAVSQRVKETREADASSMQGTHTFIHTRNPPLDPKLRTQKYPTVPRQGEGLMLSLPLIPGSEFLQKRKKEKMKWANL